MSTAVNRASAARWAGIFLAVLAALVGPLMLAVHPVAARPASNPVGYTSAGAYAYDTHLHMSSRARPALHAVAVTGDLGAPAGSGAVDAMNGLLKNTCPPCPRLAKESCELQSDLLAREGASCVR